MYYSSNFSTNFSGMITYVTMKEMHTNLKKVQKLVEAGNRVVVLKHSKPVMDINKFTNTWWENEKIPNIEEYRFDGNAKNWNNLATTFDQYIY